MFNESVLNAVQAELGFVTGSAAEGVEMLHGPALAAPEMARVLLERVGRSLKTDKLSVAASQFTKRYCRSLTAVLYEFSVAGIARSAALRNISILFPGEFPPAVHCSGRTAPVTDAAREALRELTLIRLFAHNWNPVFRTLHEVTGVREELFWENGSVYLHYFYRKWIDEAEDPSVRARLEEDYRYIHREAPPELFGELQCFNPFHRTGKPVRSMCCLRYMLPGAACCKGCPITHGNTGSDH
jgi:ferric iron reductase protein FhuF